MSSDIPTPANDSEAPEADPLLEMIGTGRELGRRARGRLRAAASRRMGMKLIV